MEEPFMPERLGGKSIRACEKAMARGFYGSLGET